MALQILPRETNWGESLGSGLGAGLSKGLQDLAEMKMKGMLEQQQAAKNEAFLNTLPGMTPEKAKAWAQASPNLQQVGLKDLLNAPYNQAFSQGAAKVLSGQGTDELQNLYTQMKPDQALKLAQFQQQQEANKIKTQGQAEKQKIEFTKNIEPWLKNEDAISNQINEMSSIADRAQGLLEEMGSKNYPGLFGRGIGEMSSGWLYPSVKEFYNTTGELALAKVTALKGQPTNFKIRLVQSIKPGLSSDYKTNMRMLRRYREVGEARGRRQAFRDSLKGGKDQFPADVQSIMSEYDNAMNQPGRHKKFFEKYPEAKEDADFLSREYEVRKMKEEDEKYGKNGPKKSASSELKLGAILNELPPANSVPTGTVLTDKEKGKSYVTDGKNWRAA